MGSMQIVASAEGFKLAATVLMIEPGGTAIEQFDLEGAMKTFFFTLGLGVIGPAMPELDPHTQ